MYWCPRCRQFLDKVSAFNNDENNNSVIITDCGGDCSECESFDCVDGRWANPVVIHDPITRKRRVQNVASTKFICVDDDDDYSTIDCEHLRDNDDRFVLTVTTFLCHNKVVVTTFQTSKSGKFVCATVDGSSGRLVIEKMDNCSLPTDNDQRFFYQTKTRRDETISYFRSVCYDDFVLVYEDERLVLRQIADDDIESHFEAHFAFVTGQ